MRRHVPLLAGLLTVCAASPAWAAKEWYEHYFEARDELIPNERYPLAIKSLEQAIQMRKEPDLDAQTYGLQFFDYFPYYWRGLCHLKRGDHEKALADFDEELRWGAIKKRKDMHQRLQQHRREAKELADREAQSRAAGQALRHIQNLLQEAEQAQASKDYDSARQRLSDAQKAAEIHDPNRVSDIRERIKRVNDQASQDERNRLIAQALAEGQRLLDARNETEAIDKFARVLALDPRSPQALEGTETAKERIRASTTRQERQRRFEEGKKLFEEGKYEEAIKPLTDAAADPSYTEAVELLNNARATAEKFQRARELRIRIQQHFEEGERLLREKDYSAAEQRFREVIRLDKYHPLAQDRLKLATEKATDAILEKFRAHEEPPAITLVEPRDPETAVDGRTVTIRGVASDDRGLAKVELRVGENVVAEQSATPRLNPAEPLRNLSFNRELPLDPGPNEITVVATDLRGLVQSQALRVTRRLRFYETSAFLPSAAASALGILGFGLGVQRVRRKKAVRNRFNPYIAGAPVLDDDMFFGRQKLLARLLNVLHHNSLMLTGERRIGKTSFLFHLKKALEADEGTEYKFFPVSADLQGVPESSFFHSVMADILDALKPSPETVNPLRFRPEHEPYDGREFGHDLQRIIEDLKKQTEKEVKLVLLIDEVDVLNEYSERTNQRLRSIFMKTFSEHLVAVMSGVGIRRSWKSEGSPWYNFFDEIELTGIQREDAEALIRTPVEGIFRYDPEAVENILEHSGMKPYLIQKFCIHAVNRILEERRTKVTALDVEAVRDDVLSDRDEDADKEVALDHQASA